MSSDRCGYVVYCRCAFCGVVPAGAKDAALEALAGSGGAFEAVADLCELAARGDPALVRWAGGAVRLIAACRPRAVRWLFQAAGAPLDGSTPRLLDMKADPPEPLDGLRPPAGTLGEEPGADPPEGSLKVVLDEGPRAARLDPARRRQLLAELLDAGYRVAVTGPAGTFPADTAASIVLGHFQADPRTERLARLPGRVVWLDVSDKCACGAHQAVDEARESLGLPKPGRWVPWFPVLDLDRCTHCRQCANFCLFGVYEVGPEGKVRVARPEKCKTDCPACARMCPRAAIIFPKYPAAPIDGSEVRPEDLRREKVGTGARRLLEGDVYQALRSRGRTPTGGAGPTPAELAEAAEELDIPAHVLTALGARPAGAAEPDNRCACRPEMTCCQNGAVHDDCCRPGGNCCDEPGCCDDAADAVPRPPGKACCGVDDRGAGE